MASNVTTSYREQVDQRVTELCARAERMMSAVTEISLLDQIDRALLDVAEAEAWSEQPHFEESPPLVELAAGTLIVAQLRLNLVEAEVREMPIA